MIDLSLPSGELVKRPAIYGVPSEHDLLMSACSTQLIGESDVDEHGQLVLLMLRKVDDAPKSLYRSQ